MANNNMKLNGPAYEKAILVAVVTVAAIGVIGASFAHDTSVQIIGFCSLIAVSLLGLLQGVKAAVKVEEVATKQDITIEATKTHGEKLDNLSEKIHEVTGEVHKIELATNSMKDRLVKTTGEQEHARGVLEEKERKEGKGLS
jgi:hypothetical protein